MKYTFSGKSIVLLLLLFVSHAFFLWMFLASEGLEQLADAYRITGGQGGQDTDTRALAYQFAAQWRHGMTGGWPLYMPGFFATAIATWFWSAGKTIRRLIAEAIVIMILASLTARLLAPAGTSHIVEAFLRQTGFQREGSLLGSTIAGFSAGLYTLITWSTFIIAGQRALARRSFKPFWLPAILCIVLAMVRTMTVDDFTSYWADRVVEGDGVAIFSLLLVPSLAAVFIWAVRLK